MRETPGLYAICKELDRLSDKIEIAVSLGLRGTVADEVNALLKHNYCNLRERRTMSVPTKEGFYWGKWRIKCAGTADEDDPPANEWEVMHVVENCIDETDPEFLMVMVPGVAKWQPLENFFWHLQELKPPK